MSSVSVGRAVRRGACAGVVGALVVAGLGSGVAVAADPALPHYVCTLPTWTKPRLKVDFAFGLRVDQVVPDATGRVTVRPYDGSAAFAFDPNTRNNSAKVVVNPSA